LSCGAQNAVPRLSDIERIEPALAEFAKARDRENAGFGAFSLQPFRAFAAAIQAASPLRDDALGPDLVHSLEQLFANTHEVIDINDSRAACRANNNAEEPAVTGQWRVEWFDHDGRCELEIFTGHNARRQALRYAMRRYGHFKEVQPEEQSEAPRLP